MNDPAFDFDDVIAEKVAELEEQHDKTMRYLEFAKTIKLTGCVPTTTKLGSVRFDDFLAHARENWNFYDDPKTAPFMKVADTLISKEPREWSADDVDRVLEMFENFTSEDMMHTYALHGYYQVISDMRDLGHDSDTVQRVVRLLHEYLISHNTEPELDGEITPQFVAKYTVPFFLGGDTAVLYKRNYGEDGCLFIAQALAYYGGYDIKDL